MQTTNFQNTRLFSFEDLRQSALPSKEQFFALESNRQLLSARPLWLSIFLRMLMLAVLSMGVPTYLVLIWVVLSLSVNQWLYHLINIYERLTANNPHEMSEQMRDVSKQFKVVFELNAIVWAGASILSQYWLSDLPRVLVHTVLTAVMYLMVTLNCSHLGVMHRVTFITLGLALVANLFRFVVNPDSQHALYLFLGFSFYLFLNGFLLWLVGKRFNEMFKDKCESEYVKLQLIESLEKSQEKLSVEQDALLGANALIQQFYSAAAHDLRQPVYAMEIYTDMLHDDPSKLETLLPKIAQSCMSINAMFNELFDFQQKHMGDTKLERSKLSIPDTLQNLALHFEPIAESKKLGISFKPLEGHVDVVPLYFVRILSNLIANAITYTPTGRILVAARKSGKFLSFEIWDTGTGIEKAAQDKIFDEFYRVNTSGKKTSNLGLGLAIVKELVKRIDGAKIRVQSVVGHGTVFKLLLPIETYSAPQKPNPLETAMHYNI
jgi:two-component system, sensor histidine kinase